MSKQLGIQNGLNVSLDVNIFFDSFSVSSVEMFKQGVIVLSTCFCSALVVFVFIFLTTKSDCNSPHRDDGLQRSPLSNHYLVEPTTTTTVGFRIRPDRNRTKAKGCVDVIKFAFDVDIISQQFFHFLLNPM